MIHITPWLMVFCGLIFIIYAQNDWMPRHRFFVPILPFVFLIMVHGIFELFQLIQTKKSIVVLFSVVIIGMCGGNYLSWQLFAPEPIRHPSERTLARQGRAFWFVDVPHQISHFEFELEDFSLYVVKNVPAGEYIFLRDIGLPGYLSMNPICDTVGLVTPIFAQARSADRKTAEKIIVDEIEKRKPACIRVVLLDKKPNTPDQLIYRWLETNPTGKIRYRRILEMDKRKHGRSIYVYLRTNLPEVNARGRLTELMQRFPEYRQKVLSELDAMVDYTR